ncbi:hypothetical protein [Nesterenkonia sp. NBAIMH1]|uniref:hypothetical protein n=1 Tax=Nesterenkonia sp. NBAIMH1 TaxID=2600320 RepID=UPI0011B4B6B2|nr:hypothetical protein [Nesterenkonia sp. NBAIMH1]
MGGDALRLREHPAAVGADQRGDALGPPADDGVPEDEDPPALGDPSEPNAPLCQSLAEQLLGRGQVPAVRKESRSGAMRSETSRDRSITRSA